MLDVQLLPSFAYGPFSLSIHTCISCARDCEVLHPRGALRGARMLGVMVRLPSVRRLEGVMQDVKLQADFKLFCLVEVVPILYPRNSTQSLRMDQATWLMAEINPGLITGAVR